MKVVIVYYFLDWYITSLTGKRTSLTNLDFSLQFLSMSQSTLQTAKSPFIQYILFYLLSLYFFQEWQRKGGEVYELIEPVDGFHPTLEAEALAAKALWRILESKIPHVLGKVNPNNFMIEAVFGDQGGY